MTQRPMLSLVVPAYNESARLPETLDRIWEWVERCPYQSEVVFVDDGSDDDSLQHFTSLAESKPETVRVLALSHRGKGAAVTAGVLDARGDVVVFTDADLSVPLTEVELLRAALAAGADVAIGSRELAGSTRSNEPRYRHLMGRAFNLLVQCLLIPGIRDTQCGFKAFKRPAAMAIFGRLRRYGRMAPVVEGPRVTAFDVEVLFLARKLGYRVAEVPVHWVHGPGSKVRPGRDSLRMLQDVLAVRIAEARGEYAE